MICLTQVRNYSPNMVVMRYVRKEMFGRGYVWCEVGIDRSCDLRQGTAEAHEIPEDVRAKADASVTVLPGYVEWPL